MAGPKATLSPKPDNLCPTSQLYLCGGWKLNLLQALHL